MIKKALSVLRSPRPAATHAIAHRVYVFMTKRGFDKEAWPNVYRNQAFALKAPDRVSPVVPVDIPATQQDLADLRQSFGSKPLTFSALRAANLKRLPLFKNKHGVIAHSKRDGSDWSPAQWLQAVLGELGEYANIRKKFERGDITQEVFAKEAADELADVVTYIDLLAFQLGINLAEAVVSKFNRISLRAGTPEIQLAPNCKHENAAPHDGEWHCQDCGDELFFRDTRSTAHA